MIAVRAPEYWPGPEFFALADAADRLVLADTLQYSRQSHQNRARLRTPQGAQWISIPLGGRQHGRPICDVEIRGKPFWVRKHRRSLHYNYRTTPYFEFFEAEMAPVFEPEWRRLGDLTCATVRILARLLRIDTPIVRASELEGAPSDVGNIFEAAGGGGLVIPHDTAHIDGRHASELRVVRFGPLHYRQNFEDFEAGMSALDLLFNYGPESLTIIRSASSIDEAVTSGGDTET